MAIEVKRISVNAIERAIKASDERNYVKIDWYGEEVIVKRKLNIAEMIAFVQGVADASFSDDGTYMPEVSVFSRRCAVLSLYGNFRLPENVERRYDFVYSDVMKEAEDAILSQVDREQYEEIIDAIQDRIDLRANSNIEKANIEVQNLVRSLSDMDGLFRETFGNVSPDEIKMLVGALAQGVDEEKLVNAYMDRKYTGDQRDNVIEFVNRENDGADSTKDGGSE